MRPKKSSLGKVGPRTLCANPIDRQGHYDYSQKTEFYEKRSRSCPRKSDRDRTPKDSGTEQNSYQSPRRKLTPPQAWCESGRAESTVIPSVDTCLHSPKTTARELARRVRASYAPCFQPFSSNALLDCRFEHHPHTDQPNQQSHLRCSIAENQRELGGGSFKELVVAERGTNLRKD